MSWVHGKVWLLSSWAQFWSREFCETLLMAGPGGLYYIILIRSPQDTVVVVIFGYGRTRRHVAVVLRKCAKLRCQHDLCKQKQVCSTSRLINKIISSIIRIIIVFIINISINFCSQDSHSFIRDL